MRRSHRHALTLLEMLIVLVWIGFGYIGIAKALGHALRISERAQTRSALTTAALSELEHRRADTESRAALEPWMEIAVAQEPAADGALTAIAVTARAVNTEPPLEVTLTGWVAAP